MKLTVKMPRKIYRFEFLTVVGLLLVGLLVTGLQAQHSNRHHNNNRNNRNNSHNSHNNNNRNRHHNNNYSPGYRINHNDRVIKDLHGSVIGNYYSDVLHDNSTYIVPHTSNPRHHGTYYVENSNYYYRARTAARGHAVQKPVQVAFGAYSRVDDLAERLEVLSNQFCIDLHYNYAHNHGFRKIYREAYQILQVAQFIHAAEHGNDRKAIRAKLGGLDALFHHVQDAVRGWSRQHRRQVGNLGIFSKMDMIESTLHHLMNDVGVHLQGEGGGGGGQAPPPASVGVEQAPPPL